MFLIFIIFIIFINETLITEEFPLQDIITNDELWVKQTLPFQRRSSNFAYGWLFEINQEWCPPIPHPQKKSN